MRIILMLLTLCFISCSFPSSQNTLSLEKSSHKSSGWYKDLINLPQVEYTLPEVTSWQMANGLKVFYLQDSELPLVSGKLIIPVGSYHATQIGLRHSFPVAISQMRYGGAGALGPDTLDLKLEELAAAISSNSNSETLTVSFSSLNETLDQVFDLFADVIFKPRYDQSRLNLWKSQSLESIIRRKDAPENIARLSYKQLIYQGTPFSEVLTSKDVRKVKRTDLLKIHRKFIVPNNAYLVLTGDLNQSKAKQLTQKHFADWKKTQNELPVVKPIQYQYTPGIYFISGPFEQSTIYLAQKGPIRLGPDHYNLQVFNDLFGTKGFASKLFQNVRKDKGYAYVTYGISAEDILPGRNAIYLQTKAENTVNAIEASIESLESLQFEKVAKKDVSNIVRSIENSFVFKYDNYAEIVSRKAYLELMNYPENYQESFLDNIRSVTAQDVMDVANKYWDKNDFIVLVVGPTTAYTLLSEAVNNADSYLNGKELIELTFDEKANL